MITASGGLVGAVFGLAFVDAGEETLSYCPAESVIQLVTSLDDVFGLLALRMISVVLLKV